MLVVAASALLGFIGASLLVGVRLLLLHRRTGAWPELLLGAMLLLSVCVGYPLRIAAQQLGGAWAVALVIVSEAAISIGFSLLFLFTWRVFRPRATWARLFAAAGILVLFVRALVAALQAASRGVADATSAPLGDILLQIGPVMVAYVWTAWESLRYYAVIRRRVKLGLADATVADRFLIWGLMGVTATAGVLLNAGAVALHLNVFDDPRILVASSITGFGQTAWLVLAFVPPRAYLDRVRARAAATRA